MKNRSGGGKLAGGALVAALLVMTGGIQAADAQATRPDSVPLLLRTIEFGDYASPVVRFGDLNGDGQIEALVVQEDASGGQNQVMVTCLTAIDLDGKILWQVGKPDPHNIYTGGDIAVQIHDIDGDGQVEVIYQDPKSMLTILDGKTGRQKRQVQLAGGFDCLLFADLTGSGRAQQLVVKDRYSNFWVYDAAQDFKLLWSKEKAVTGHYGFNYDFNGDGKDELLIGYTLYAPDGKVIWSHPEFPHGRAHDDAIYVSDMDGDGRAEIALATSSDAYLLDADGNILFVRPMIHSQHALIGRFRTDLPGKQAFYISREESTIVGNIGSLPPERGGGQRRPLPVLEAFYTKAGELLWDNTKQGQAEPDGMGTQGAVVENWTGNPNENFVCLYRRGIAPPELLDGAGRVVTVFQIPARPPRRAAERAAAKGGPATKAGSAGKERPAHKERPAAQEGQPEMRERYVGDYVKHIDVFGDEREEILIFNEYALYIFTNAAPLPGKAAPATTPVVWKRSAAPLREKAEWYNDNIYNGRR